jgi:hypothetical protein
VEEDTKDRILKWSAIIGGIIGALSGVGSGGLGGVILFGFIGLIIGGFFGGIFLGFIEYLGSEEFGMNLFVLAAILFVSGIVFLSYAFWGVGL